MSSGRNPNQKLSQLPKAFPGKIPEKKSFAYQELKPLSEKIKEGAKLLHTPSETSNFQYLNFNEIEIYFKEYLKKVGDKYDTSDIHNMGDRKKDVLGIRGLIDELQTIGTPRGKKSYATMFSYLNVEKPRLENGKDEDPVDQIQKKMQAIRKLKNASENKTFSVITGYDKDEEDFIEQETPVDLELRNRRVNSQTEAVNSLKEKINFCEREKVLIYTGAMWAFRLKIENEKDVKKKIVDSVSSTVGAVTAGVSKVTSLFWGGDSTMTEEQAEKEKAEKEKAEKEKWAKNSVNYISILPAIGETEGNEFDAAAQKESLEAYKYYIEHKKFRPLVNPQFIENVPLIKPRRPSKTSEHKLKKYMQEVHLYQPLNWTERKYLDKSLEKYTYESKKDVITTHPFKQGDHFNYSEDSSHYFPQLKTHYRLQNEIRSSLFKTPPTVRGIGTKEPVEEIDNDKGYDYSR